MDLLVDVSSQYYENQIRVYQGICVLAIAVESCPLFTEDKEAFD